MIKSYPKEKDRITVDEFRKLKVKPEKSLSALKKDLDKVFNAWIRRRDSNNGMFICVSCSEFKPVRLMHAGHFYSAGHNEAVRWDENNVHGQCSHCNTYLHGNLIEYQCGLISRIGWPNFKILTNKKNNKSRMLKFEVRLLIDTYKAKMK